MSKEKHSQREVSPAAGILPAAGTPLSSNQEGDNIKDNNITSAKSGANIQQQTIVEAKKEIIPILTICEDVTIIVCGTYETLPLLTKAWKEKAAAATIIFQDVSPTPFPELITAMIADDTIPDTFILVPENCFPTANLTLADLTALRVRKFLDGRKNFDTRLPVLLDATAILKTLEYLDDEEFTAETFFEKYNSIAYPGTMAEEIGMSFGNVVAYADKPTPCMAKVAEALIRKKFICTTADGFSPIKEQLALLYAGK